MATAEKTQVQMVTLEIDGQSISVPAGSMIIEASDQIGIDIPRFCYHRKLSIAANCRMCLVDVEKAPKPLPACATPVAEGMKVFTESRRAVDAQRGVMEFLLINHPLDCPICDQGGECELQDLAMGYGRSVSRFTERKRVVKDKNLGPLVATDMTRCIHCTRCVRFLEEIAGTTELGGIGRGEKTEISTFVERNINSELSGNIIDLCPVGALTNKPFRFSARAWEMRAKTSIASHDNVGSNLFFHVRGRKVMRAVPKDNDAVNECWLSDRDRYSHYGLDSADCLGAPRVKVEGVWKTVSWDEAFSAATQLIGRTIAADPTQLGVLVSPRATNQEQALLARLAGALECPNIDHRLRVRDFSHPLTGRPHMDMASADWVHSDAIFLIGSNIRHDQPILGHRVRTAWRRGGAKVMDLNPVAYECHFELAHRWITPPQAMVAALASLAQAVGQRAGVSLPEWIQARVPNSQNSHDQAKAEAMASILLDSNRGLMVLGDGALNHPEGGLLRAIGEWIASPLEVSLCILGGPANAHGAWQRGVIPGEHGLNAHEMFASPRQAYLIYQFDPASDTHNSGQAMQALRQAHGVVAMTSFVSDDLAEVADVLLPVAELAQTEGSYTNLDGKVQSFEAAVAPFEQARAGWKVLRRLGSVLSLPGFDFNHLSDIDAVEKINSAAALVAKFVPSPSKNSDDNVVWRVGDVPMYHSDPLVRRSQPLQDSDHASAPVVRLHPDTAKKLAVVTGQDVLIEQQGVSVSFPCAVDERIAPGCVWLPSAQPEVRGLGEAYGHIAVSGVKP